MTIQPQNDTEKWPFPDPRVAGVREHYQRVQFFHELAERCSDPVGRFRILLAGVYSARAVVELMFEAVDNEQLAPTRDELKERLSAQLPWYDLIERIRIHDFHRFGLVPPDPRFRVKFQGGPVKLHAKGGAAVYRVPATGPEKLTTSNSLIEEQRPFLTDDGKFFDDRTRQWVELDQIVREFVAGAQVAITQFENEFDKPRGPG